VAFLAPFLAALRAPFLAVFLRPPFFAALFLRPPFFAAAIVSLHDGVELGVSPGGTADTAASEQARVVTMLRNHRARLHAATTREL
jgi:hypothetical protein